MVVAGVRALDPARPPGSGTAQRLRAFGASGCAVLRYAVRSRGQVGRSSHREVTPGAMLGRRDRCAALCCAELGLPSWQGAPCWATGRAAGQTRPAMRTQALRQGLLIAPPASTTAEKPAALGALSALTGTSQPPTPQAPPPPNPPLTPELGPLLAGPGAHGSAAQAVPRSFSAAAQASGAGDGATHAHRQTARERLLGVGWGRAWR